MMNGDRVFTEYIASIHSLPSNAIPTGVTEKLSRILRKALRRRGLWSRPPQDLDYAGKSWADRDTFGDLLNDCFVAVFFGIGKKSGSQLAFLIEQVRVGNEIDRLVYTKIQHFIHDLQRKKSPRGASIFKTLTYALREITSSEPPLLKVLVGPSSKFDSDSIFGDQVEEPRPIEKSALGEFVRVSEDWASALKLVSRYGKRGVMLTIEAIKSTAKAGKIPFRFGDIRDVVSELAYQPSANLTDDVVLDFSSEDGGPPVLVRTFSDPDRYENEAEEVQEIISAVHIAIDKLPRRDSIKKSLHRILENYDQRIRSGADTSQAEICRDLGFAKQTMSDYMKTLRDLFESQQAN